MRDELTDQDFEEYELEADDDKAEDEFEYFDCARDRHGNCGSAAEQPPQDKLRQAAREYVNRCPMCNSGEECQDDLC
jgi:hypothetical protein